MLIYENIVFYVWHLNMEAESGLGFILKCREGDREFNHWVLN